MGLTKSIYEHLKTKKKYNTLMMQKEGIAEELERKSIQLNTQKLINETERDAFKEALDKYINEIEKLKTKLKEAKKK